MLDWRWHPDGWHALVTYLDRTTTAQRVVTEWVQADRLTPVEGKHYDGSAYG